MSEQQQEYSRPSGMSMKAWAQIVGAIIIVLGGYWVLCIVYPVVSRFSVFLAIVVAVVFVGLAVGVLGLAAVGLLALYVKHVETPRRQTSLLRPTANNMLPAVYDWKDKQIRQGSNGELPAPAYHSYAPHQVYHNDLKQLDGVIERLQSVRVQEIEAPEIEAPEPVIRSGRELIEDGTVQAALAQGKLILGYDEAGALKLMRVVDFFSCILAGIPNSGKSSTAVWLLVQLIWAGVHIILVDPHMNYQSEDGRKGLAQELEPFNFAYLPQFPPCDMDNPQEVLRRVTWAKNELNRRKRPGYVVKASDIVIITFDEFNSVIEVEEISKELADDLAYIEREGRKFGVHVMLLGHRWAQQDIGNIKIRTCASTILAHRFNDEGQGKILLGQSDGKKVVGLDPGFYWLRGILAGALAKIYTPYLEAYDIPLVIHAMSGAGFAPFPAETIVDAEPARMPDLPMQSRSSGRLPQSFQASNLQDTEALPEVNGEAAGSDGSENNGISDLSTIKTLREIGKRLRAGEDKVKIKADMVKRFGLPYGRATQEVGAVVDMIAEQIEAEA